MKAGMCKGTLFTLLWLLVTIGNCHAETIKVGVSFAIPPYVIKDKNTGIELDILREAFAVTGHEVDVVYLPFARTFMQLKEGTIDGVVNVREGMQSDAFLTDEAITFENYAISLSKNNPTERVDIDYLRDKHVLAFQRASDVLGEEFQAMAASSNHYEEIAAQKKQVLRLFLERDADFIVMEKNIFKFYRSEVEKLIGRRAKQSVVYHSLFPPTQYRFAFREKRIRDDFNRGLKQIKEDGSYQAIFTRYEHFLDRPARFSSQ